MFVNIRLSLRIMEASCCLCWVPINICICKFGFGDQPNGAQYICRDRVPTIPTLTKYSFIIVATLILLTQASNFSESLGTIPYVSMEQELSIESIKVSFENLKKQLWIFALQHVIFILFRILLTLCVNILCSGCSDEEVEEIERPDGMLEVDYDPYMDSVVSFNYEKYMATSHNLQKRSALEDYFHDKNMKEFRMKE